MDCNDNFSPIAGATGQSFTATQNGEYAVEITLTGCTNASNCVNITGIGVGELRLNNYVNVYPNPSKGQFTVTIEGYSGSATIIVLDVLGNEVYSTSTTNESTAIQLIEQASGVYFVQVQTTSGTTTNRIAIR